MLGVGVRSFPWKEEGGEAVLSPPEEAPAPVLPFLLFLFCLLSLSPQIFLSLEISFCALNFYYIFQHKVT